MGEIILFITAINENVQDLDKYLRVTPPEKDLNQGKWTVILALEKSKL